MAVQKNSQAFVVSSFSLPVYHLIWLSLTCSASIDSWALEQWPGLSQPLNGCDIHISQSQGPSVTNQILCTAPRSYEL